MPAISASVRPLVQDARVSRSDVDALRQRIEAGEATLADAQAIASRYADALEAGVGADLKKLVVELGGSFEAAAPIANLSAQPGLLNGLVKLPDAGRKHPAVLTVQRALIALASRTGEAAFMLPKYGADGDYGGETKGAVVAFQEKHGLAATGVVDLETAKALDKALRSTNVPPIFAPGTDPLPAGPSRESVRRAAMAIVEKMPDAYGVDDPWLNIDARHALPANVKLGGLKGKWKCNLFACNTLVAAGFEPPYYGNHGKGEYPNANQLYKWSDRYASQFGNAGHVRFELRGELDVQSLSGAAREQAIAELLKKAEPGDMIIVDHLGGDVADGGHCRVVIENDLDGSGVIKCAQASFDAALVRDETLSKFTGEEHIWILRPNKARPEGPAQV